MSRKSFVNLLLFAVMSLSCIILISCGSDDDNAPANESQRLIGKWKRANSTDYDMFGYLHMKDNGDCIRSSKPDFPEGSDTYDYYKWVYSEDSKVLRIYHEGGKTFTFQIEFTSDGGWVGTKGNETYIYQKLQ